MHQIKAELVETMQLMQKGCGYSTVYSNDLHHVNLTVLEIANDYEQNPSSVVHIHGRIAHQGLDVCSLFFHSVFNLVHNLKHTTLS